MINLIYDRTSGDVVRVEALRKKVKNRTASTAEMSEWLSSLKGAYNYTDLNRVGDAINYLANLLNSYAYYNNIKAKNDWKIGDKPNHEQMEKYLNDLKQLKETFFVFQSSPQIPNDMVSLTYEEANNIEKLIYDIDFILKNMEQNFIHSGVANAGQSRTWQQRFRRPSNWTALNYTVDKYNQAWNTVTTPSEGVGTLPTDTRETVSTTINLWNAKMNEIDALAGVI